MKNKYDPCTDPKKGYIDLTEHPFPPEIEEAGDTDEDEYKPNVMNDDELAEALRNQLSKRKGPPLGPKPLKRCYGKQEQDLEDFLKISDMGKLRNKHQGPPEFHPPDELPIDLINFLEIENERKPKR